MASEEKVVEIVKISDDLPEQRGSKKHLTRRSFSRELKLHVLKWFHKNGKKVIVASRKFKVDRKLVGRWVKEEELIRNQKVRSKAGCRGRKPLYLEVEKKLHDEFKEMRNGARLSSIAGSILVSNSCWKKIITEKLPISRHLIAGSPRFSKDMV